MDGLPEAWRVMRAAGLRSGALPMIEDALRRTAEEEEIARLAA